MSRKVLLVDADVETLGALASALRTRGLTVFNASDEFEAIQQAFQNRPDCVLLDKRLDREGDLTVAFRAVPELSDTPLFYLVADRGVGDAANDLPREDVDGVASRVISAVPRESRASIEQELRGNLEQMPVADLLQMLSMNRRSGVLSIVTKSGPGEVRLVDGEVADAVFRRVEGEKAFYRLLAEHDGRFAFSPAEVPGPRRITAPTSALLMEAMRQVDEVAMRRRELVPNGEALLVDEAQSMSMGASIPPSLPGPRAAIARELTQLLQAPRTLDELLDDLEAPDLTVLEALAALVVARKVRRVPMADVTAPFATAEQLPVLRSLVQRLARAGFAAPPRIVLAAPAPRMPALATAIRRIVDAEAPADLPPRAPLPRPLGTLRLGDGVDLALVGLPTDARFSPTWALSLAGAAAVLRLQDAGGALLEAHCAALEVPLLDALAPAGPRDLAVPAQIAALVRSALEQAAGV
ncbi:MAG TPA: DUF4388 domain-containing protein [Byssovorax sp.]